MIMLSKALLDERVDKAVKRIFKGADGWIKNIFLDFQFETGDDPADDFFGTMTIEYGRDDPTAREDLNFHREIKEIDFSPKDIENLDFFEGMIYTIIKEYER